MSTFSCSLEIKSVNHVCDGRLLVLGVDYCKRIGQSSTKGVAWTNKNSSPPASSLSGRLSSFQVFGASAELLSETR